MKKSLYTCILLFITSGIFAQSIWKADILPVEISGYYNVKLSQEIIGLSEDFRLTDIRIRDKDSKEIPYFLRSVNPVEEISSFENYALKQNIVKDSLNILIIDNNKGENISHFYIVAQNADVTKYARVRGSNDEEQWYIVKQATRISDLGYERELSDEIMILDIPQGNYKYYEITLSNNQKSPLKILRVGKIKNSSIYGQFTEILTEEFNLSDNSKDKKTYITFPSLVGSYRISKMEFKVKSKFQYLRQTRIVDKANHNSVVFDLSSKSENTFFINDFKLDKDIPIEIENNDNLPLSIDSIRVYGLNRYLCAYLEEGKSYGLYIETGNNILPDYDIEHFRKDIPNDLPVVSTLGLEQIQSGDDIAKRELSWIEKPVFLWGVIIVIGLFLVFVCVKMIKELKMRNKE
ncbi:hypothetical protein JGH11_00640 [Dysgonomonas sp. Marseille-P4677]|uniref:hypothetical protein n=1 Tax=Dysgonomonas sp. Marseille-P4677 TaxID=2364790 RepID=UPI001912EDD5|nr:hypothetical protein [Dysgonomonas sp. Marseille-P4677]MBK5719366.1 hypothetical protein [Dysgonomonas sp. Marseille-P4677]